MKLSNNLTSIKQKGHKKYKKNRCCKSSSSSSSSSCSSSSSSSSSCSSSSSSSDGSYDCLKANYGVINNLSSTNATFDTAYFNNLNFRNDLPCNIPTLLSSSSLISIPSRYSDLSQVYLLNSTPLTVTINKLSSNFDGLRLVFANVTGGNISFTFTVTASDTIAGSGNTVTINPISANNSVEFIGSWNSTTSVMTFYRIR